MSKVACCIPTSTERAHYLKELKTSLYNQTFKDFTIHTVTDIEPIGKAKYKVVELALRTHPEYIAMIDDDDIVLPTYLEKLVARMDSDYDIDWAFTWGRLFGDRKGYIHGDIQQFSELIKENHRPAQFIIRAGLFDFIKYDRKTPYAEDLQLWITLDTLGYKGSVVEEELYMRRWHDKNLTMTYGKKI